MQTKIHSNTRQLALQVWHLAKFRSVWSKRVILEIELKYDFFESFGSRPIITLHTTSWQIDLTKQSRLIMNSSYQAFYVVVIFIICCGREASASIVLNIE